MSRSAPGLARRAAAEGLAAFALVFAGCGAIGAQFLFERLHDRQIAVVDPAVADKVRPRA